MRADFMLLYGMEDGSIRVECDRFGCEEWQMLLPPHSTIIDIERAMKRHTHPRKAA